MWARTGLDFFTDLCLNNRTGGKSCFSATDISLFPSPPLPLPTGVRIPSHGTSLLRGGGKRNVTLHQSVWKVSWLRHTRHRLWWLESALTTWPQCFSSHSRYALTAWHGFLCRRRKEELANERTVLYLNLYQKHTDRKMNKLCQMRVQYPCLINWLTTNCSKGRWNNRQNIKSPLSYKISEIWDFLMIYLIEK